MNNVIRDVIFPALSGIHFSFNQDSCFPSFFSFLQTPYHAILNAFLISFRYLDKEGLVFNQFLDIVTVSDGKADTIVTAVKAVLQNKQVPTEKLCGLGTDGAAVMTGMILSLFHVSVFLRKRCMCNLPCCVI